MAPPRVCTSVGASSALQRSARTQAPTQGQQNGRGAAAASFEGAAVSLAALAAGAGGCAYVSACTERLRLELKDDLRPLAALSINMALVQETLQAQHGTLQAQQGTLQAQQAMLQAQQATLKAQQAKINASLVVGLLGLLGTAAVLHKTQ